MDNPLLVEIIAYAPTAYYHCTHCEVAWREIGVSERIHQEQVENSLPSDLLDEYQAISDWVREVFRQYCDQVIIKVIDAASPEGLFDSLRYRVHRYPVIILDHKARFASNNLQSAREEIGRLIGQGQAARA